MRKSFRELIVYQKTRALANEIFILYKIISPKEETYSLTDQIRRSSRSIGAQIAEAWAKRRYEKHFISKLTDADGEQMKPSIGLKLPSDCDYIRTKRQAHLSRNVREIGRLLLEYDGKAEMLFCNPSSHSMREITCRVLCPTD
jgi:four helix bundle protein